MDAQVFIDIVKSMINEEDFNDIEVQPMQQRRERYMALGEAFEDAIKIMEVIDESKKDS